MPWTVIVHSPAVEAELEALPADVRARFSRYGGNRPEEVDPNYAGAGYLVVNKELFTTWQWDRMTADWLNQHLIVKVSELGDCNKTVQCLRIYAFVPGPHAG